MQARRAAPRPGRGHARLPDPLPVGRLWGVGEKTRDLLGRLAIRTVGDLRRTPRPVLERLLGEAAARHLQRARARHRRTRGRAVRGRRSRSSHEETFDRDLDDLDEILRELLHLSRQGRGPAPRGRLPRADRDPEGAPGQLHHPHAVQDALGGNRSGRPTSTTSWPQLYRVAPGRAPPDPPPRASRRAGWSPPGPSSSRCCTASAGARWSGRWTGSRSGSAAVPRPPRPCSIATARPHGHRRSDDPGASATLGPEGRSPTARRLACRSTITNRRSSTRSSARLAEDDPSFVEQVGRTDLYTPPLASHPRVGVRVRRRTAPALPVRRVGVVRRRRVRR